MYIVKLFFDKPKRALCYFAIHLLSLCIVYTTAAYKSMWHTLKVYMLTPYVVGYQFVNVKPTISILLADNM